MVFKELGISFCLYRRFPEFLKNGKGRVFGFAFLLVLLYFTGRYVAPFAHILIGTQGLQQEIDDNLPDFELSGGELWVEEYFEYNEGGRLVVIDTTPEEYFLDSRELKNELNEYYQVILIDSEKIVIKNRTELSDLYFSDLDWEMTRSELGQFLKSTFTMAAIVVIILLFLGVFATFFLGALIVAVIAMIMASCMKVSLTFGQIYLLSIYSRTLSLFIKAVMSYMPFDMPFFWIMNYGISALIFWKVFTTMKENVNKNHVPLEFRSDNPYGTEYSPYDDMNK